jgi:sugar phosphate isomerase/epimerase
MIALLGRVKCDRLGVCLDTGNSLALLEAPAETVEALAPLAFSCHLKDMAVEESADGFLLSEVPFGEGVLDMPKVVGVIRRANPEVKFQVEMITRDPLKIPCLTDGYWSTFPELPGRHLAHALRFVRDHRAKTPLPRISNLPAGERLKAEDENIRRCVAFAGEMLGL